MNLIQKARNFIYLKRQGMRTRAAILAFKGRLTEGDKYFIALAICVVTVGVVLKCADRIDGPCVVAEVRK